MSCQEEVMGIIGGFAAGKTNIGAQRFIDRMMAFPEGNHAIAGKDLPQLKRGTIISLQQELDERQIAYRYNKSTGEVIIRENGAHTLLLSAENYQGWRALEADTIWADELTTWGPDAEKAFLEFLLPRKRLSPKGKMYTGLVPMLYFTTNPPTTRSHWLYDLLVRKEFCRYWQMSTYDNYLLPNQEAYIRTLKKAFSPDLWPILIGGEWGDATTGLVYKTFKRELHDWNYAHATWPKELPPMQVFQNEPLNWALDFNVGLMCSIVSQTYVQKYVIDREKVHEMFRPIVELEYIHKRMAETHQRTIQYVIDELRLPDSGTPDVLNEFLVRWGDHARRRGVRLYGDASGGARAQQITALSSARSNWQIIMEGFIKAGIPYEFKVQRANPAVMDRVNSHKAQLVDIDGVGLIIDGNRAPYLCQDYESVGFKEGTNDINKEDPQLTHLSDGLGYQCWLERELERGEQVNMIAAGSLSN